MVEHEAPATPTGRLMFDILGGPFPYIGALISFLLLVAGLVAFTLYIARFVRNARDDKKSAIDTE